VTLLLVALVAILTGCGTLSGALDSLATAPAASGGAPAESAPGGTASRPVAGAPASSVALGEGAPPGAETQPESPLAAAPGFDPPLAILVAADSRAPAPAGATIGSPESAASEASRAGEAIASTPDGSDDQAAGMAQARETAIGDESEDYDPWEPYNERMFAFNYNVDRYVLKPAANVYRRIMPEPWQLMIANGFDNIRYPARLVNHVLQGRIWGAFIETSRFLINSTLGFGGLFNPATDYFGIPKSRADFGQTMARWGIGAGPYFVPPFLPPATVRDFLGRLADSAINPIAWFLIDFWPEGIGIGMGEMLNERAINYEAFQGVEETTLDLYTAVRDGYLRRRELQLRQDVE
jgi:phospholipid-binding lipoprotein MlaA